MKFNTLYIALALVATIVGCASEPSASIDSAYLRPEFNDKYVRTVGGEQVKDAASYVADDKLFAKVNVFSGETLRAAISRIAPELNFSRAVIDLEPGTPDPSNYRFQTDLEVRAESLYDLGDRLFALAGAPYTPGFYSANDGRHTSLAIAAPTYKAGSVLNIFTVEEGMLSANAERLAVSLGWIAPAQSAWRMDHDYPVHFSYPIVVGDAMQGYGRLFRRFPVQAQLNEGSKQVFFVRRPAPKVTR